MFGGGDEWFLQCQGCYCRCHLFLTPMEGLVLERRQQVDRKNRIQALFFNCHALRYCCRWPFYIASALKESSNADHRATIMNLLSGFHFAALLTGAL